MTRSVRFAMLGALLLGITSPVFARANKTIASGVKKAVTKVTEKSSTQPQTPWYKNTLSSWKSYLAKAPKADYLPEVSGEGLSLRFEHSWATQGFGADGSAVDPSALAFGRSHFGVRDMFAASDLLVNEEVSVVKDLSQSTPLPNNSRHFLYLLANQELGFDSHYSKQQVTLSYDRLFLNNRLALSLEIPLVRKEHSLTFDKKYEITRSNREALVEVTSLNTPLFRSVMGDASATDAPAFYQKYNDMRTLVASTLAQSGVHIKKTQEVINVGDIKLGATFLSKLNYVDRARFGAELVIGTGTQRRNIALFEPQTSEKNGATQLRVNAALEWNRGRFVNPFLNASFGYSLPVGVARRIPYMLRHDGQEGAGSRMMEVMPRTVPFSELLSLNSVSFAQPEAKIREVSSTVQKATLHQGFDFSLRLGNVCENCFNRPIVFSIAYDMRMHQGDRYTGLDRDREFAMDVMTQNTYGLSSSLMSSVGYRLNKDCFVSGACEYRLAGRNELATVSCNGGIAFRF